MNETAQLNLALADRLQSFDPYGAGIGCYETEVADVICAVHRLEESEALAAEISRIYEYAFDAPLPEGSPLRLAASLLAMKRNAACSL